MLYCENGIFKRETVPENDPDRYETKFVFHYQFKYSDGSEPARVMFNREMKIIYPLRLPLEELCHQLVDDYNMPEFVLEDLHSKLKSALTLHDRRLIDEEIQNKLKQLRLKDGGSDKLRKRLRQKEKKERLSHVINEEDSIQSNPAKIAALYKKLLHTSALHSILNVEHAYSVTVQELIKEREFVLNQLEHRQQQELAEALSDSSSSDQRITNFARRQVEQLEFEVNHWNSKLKELKKEQTSQFHEWLCMIDKDPNSGVSSGLSSTPERTLDTPHTPNVTSRLEESFTIQLGAQLKTSHNLRLIAVDPLDLCRIKTQVQGGSSVPDVQRLQTSLNLFSDNLCALVLLVDDRLRSPSGLKKEFEKVCDQCTDFHFPEYEDQISEIERELTETSDRLPSSLDASQDSASISSIGTGSIDSYNSIEYQTRKNKLDQGSIYITKHSNLAEIHKVFHLVSDESLFSDINSRHAVIMSLRIILKYCYQHQINTLNIPLLLAQHMSEEMTIPWCTKRAELVLKCVKGFMMEMGTWADTNSKNIQFLVPPNLSPDTFTLLSSMLPSIFKQSAAISVPVNNLDEIRSSSPRNVNYRQSRSPRR